MRSELLRKFLTVHAPELEVVELPEAHTTDYISQEWNVLPAQVAKTLRVCPESFACLTEFSDHQSNGSPA